MHDEVARAEQRADRRHVGGVSADKGHAGVLAVVVGKRGFERAMNRPLARHEPACAGGNAVPIDRRMGGRADPGMTIEAEIIVGREIDHAAAVDHGRSAGVAFVNEEERIPQTQRRGGGAQKPLFVVTGQIAEIEPDRAVGGPPRLSGVAVGAEPRRREPALHQTVEEQPIRLG